MEIYLQLFTIVPLLAFFASLLIHKNNERVISALAIGTIGTQVVGALVFVILWLTNRCPILDIKHYVFYKADNIEIFIDFYFDKTTAVFAVMGAILTFLVAVFSRFYLHRDEGFKRYFNTLLLFFLGYNIAVFSGNFETLFMGWEILGICSFLLIAFYRDRYLPVKNSLKVISLYRLGDICLILAMWMSHHLWHQNITFWILNDTNLVIEHITEHNWYAFFIALMIVIAAAAKSAQLPFSSWLPRAMEGPTTSSAIFYGSLSVHLGVFLLIRTYPYWETLSAIKGTIIFIGIATSVIGTSIARVQSSVKTQIAYASITQIGLMFVEVALGFHSLALFHFAGNAFLRTYQLLVSPSVLGYLIHDQFFTYTPPQYNSEKSSFQKLKNTIYILSVKEWNLDRFQYRLFWAPFKWVGRKMSFLSSKVGIIILTPVFFACLYSNLYQEEIHSSLFDLLPFVCSLAGLLLVLKAFAYRGDAIRAWWSVIAAQLFITLSITLLHENFGENHIAMYLGGTVVSALIGYICLKQFKAIDKDISLNQFHGYSYEQPRLSFIFLIACMGLVGLPFTPTFIGIDILFSHIHKHEEILIILTALSFVFIELAILRIYARVCLGQHKKPYHPIAYRSS